MIEDEEGFRYSIIDKNKCIECRKCIGVCQIHQETNKNNFNESKYFSAQHKNDEIIMESSSGGVFSALANIILEQGGVVYGCIYDENMKAIQVEIEILDDLKLMRGSKYVQSDMLNCHIQVKKQLDEGRYVLFTGTSCQVASIKAFIGREYENLLLVEILCHGVPSPKLFKDYIDYLQGKHKGKVINYEFRNKKRDGWGSEHRSYYEVEKGNKIKGYRPILPAYFCAFFYGINLRPSCYECKHATLKRSSDITLGDFWGYWKKYKRNFPKGISVIGINSMKGMEFIDKLSKVMIIENISFEEATASNTNFTKPVNRPANRDDFYRRLSGKKYSEINKIVFLDHRNWKNVFKSIYGRFIPQNIRKYRHFIQDKMKI
jgi:coenzyme F420-reducing hydrogenase beta subunit